MKILLAWAVITALIIALNNWEAWTDYRRAKIKKKTDKHALDVALFIGIPSILIIGAVLLYGFAWELGVWTILHLFSCRYLLFSRLFNRKMGLHPFYLNPDVWWDGIEAKNIFFRHQMTKMGTFLLTSFFMIVYLLEYFGQKQGDQFGWIIAVLMVFGVGFVVSTLLISPERKTEIKEKWGEKRENVGDEIRDLTDTAKRELTQAVDKMQTISEEGREDLKQFIRKLRK